MVFTQLVKLFEDMLLCKTALTVDAVHVKAANTPQSRNTWNPDSYTCIHIKSIADYYGNAGALRYVQD